MALAPDLSQYVEETRLPPGAMFDNPRRLHAGPLLLMAQWIIDGEHGKIPPEKRFRWIGQDERGWSAGKQYVFLL